MSMSVLMVYIFNLPNLFVSEHAISSFFLLLCLSSMLISGLSVLPLHLRQFISIILVFLIFVWFQMNSFHSPLFLFCLFFIFNWFTFYFYRVFFVLVRGHSSVFFLIHSSVCLFIFWIVFPAFCSADQCRRTLSLFSHLCLKWLCTLSAIVHRCDNFCLSVTGIPFGREFFFFMDWHSYTFVFCFLLIFFICLGSFWANKVWIFFLLSQPQIKCSVCAVCNSLPLEFFNLRFELGNVAFSLCRFWRDFHLCL